MSTALEIEFTSPLRRRLLEFLIRSTHVQELQVRPIIKYSALSIFVDRFCPSLSQNSNDSGSWLLNPMSESNLQLFALISIWVSSKIHDPRSLSVKSLKSLGDKLITEQHFTTRDFVNAEVVMLKVLNFEIGTSSIAFKFLEELLSQFNGVARVGDLINFEACMDIMDLVYEKQENSTLYNSPRHLAASVLVASYVITVPKQKWEFPVLPWVKFVASCNEDDILEMVRGILKHVFAPNSDLMSLEN